MLDQAQFSYFGNLNTLFPLISTRFRMHTCISALLEHGLQITHKVSAVLSKRFLRSFGYVRRRLQIETVQDHVQRKTRKLYEPVLCSNIKTSGI